MKTTTFLITALLGHLLGQAGIIAFRMISESGWWERHIISKYPFDDEM
jgi:hypothetical protein